MKTLSLIIFLLLVNSSLKAAELTHCSNEERVVFSCSTGKKFVSVCASKDASKDKGYVQYRYGVINKPELIFPENREPANKNFSYQYNLYASGYSNDILFNIGTFNYIVSYLFAKGDESGSVEVIKSGKNIANIICKSKPNNVEQEILSTIGMKEITQ